MSTEENKANVRRWTEEGWNQRKEAVFDELAASNWVHHDPGLPNVHTLADYKRWASETHNAFPDYHVTIEDMIAEGDKVVIRHTFHGCAGYMGYPPGTLRVNLFGYLVL